jgi:hypothetical protein
MMSANKNHAALCSRATAATAMIIDNITHEKRMDGAILSPFVGASTPTFQRGAKHQWWGSIPTAINAKPAS